MEQLSDALVREVADPNAIDWKAPANMSTGPSAYYHHLNGVNQPVNMLWKQVLWWTLGGMGFIMLAIRIGTLVWSKLRHVAAMSEPREKQGYWKISQWSWMPSLKKHLVYAPLFYKRHNREFRLSSAMNVGTLPSRFHSLILFIYNGSNLAYMLVLDWNQENKYALAAEMRGRSGTLALVNMVPLIIFAGRNNPLIGMLCISFDTYNLLHRWLGRLTVFQVVIHTIAWCIPAVADRGFQGMVDLSLTHAFYWSGWIGTITMVILLITAFSPIRHAFYETFLNIHIVTALIAFIMTVIHCLDSNLGAPLPQYPWIIAICLIWALERFARFIRLAWTNYGSTGMTYAVCEPMPGEVTRVTMHLPRYVRIKPGTHAYLRFFGIRSWESHPFSTAWVEHNHGSHTSLPVSEKDPLANISRDSSSTSVSFLVGAQTGMTKLLYERVSQSCSIGGSMRIKAALEGPYAGHHSLDSYGHAVLFAGSTGITHQLSYLRHLLQGYNDGTVATRRLTLVWIIRDFGSLEWVRPYMDQILRMPNRKDILRIQIFVTRPQNPSDVTSASNTVRMFPGRPNIPLLLVKEIQEQVGAMCVTVCGPGALADDVRGAVRAVQGETVVDFVEESFTW
ncbi:unnamed protein product [Clonostachys rhizophaga]|uniref:FAD-binding FR-type domain-containing protein n=1 Tax=Clonostachys rhizophaga TaxID=160324 RepID=A0A9N9VFZ9_9HYPO|nr:unnamed protein product [Clonostachys rhizophaga]